MAAAVGLVGNLATNTVELSWRWWPAVAWTATGMLLAASAVFEWVRHRSGADPVRMGASGSEVRVFGAIPQQAWHWQERPDEATALRETLGGKGRTALVALPGERGAGKSQLAATYARRCVADGYDLVAWINTESGPVTGLALLADQLGLSKAEQTPEAAATAVRRWLERDDRARRLVVFDNVDDPDALGGFLPATGTSKVIITSNRREFTSMPGITAVSVGMFTPAQGLAFLGKATGLPTTDDAREVGEQLGWLPLGLAQAAAYMVHDRLSYRQYLAALEEQDLDETLRRQAGTDHPGVLKATQLSLAGLRRTAVSGDAARLVTVLSLLSSNGISRTLLTQAETALSLKVGLRHALQVLAARSLITLGGTTQDQHGGDGVVVSMHRLTARVIRHQVGKPPGKALATAITTATRMLHTLTDEFPYTQVAHRRAELDELAAHVLTLRGYSHDPSHLLLSQCDWVGKALYETGDLTRAIPVLTATLADRERILGPDHPDTLTSRNNLAAAYRAAGRHDEAINLHRRTVVDRERVLGPDHPDTLTSRNNLAGAYRTAGRHDEAIPLTEAVLADRERVLGPDHPDTLGSRNNLAGAYRAAGRHDEAIALIEAVLADCERVLGPDHHETLGSRNNLAGAYRAGGRHDEAIPLTEAVVADCERVLGPDHPHTLTNRNGLAEAYRSVGRLDEAIALYRQTLADCERVLGPDHPLSVTVRDNLASARRSRYER
ncbi:tetratricopeptide repeat protein [Micromonospora globispora]|uniref:tetratricopeptide repeat protein n=1 Tax=Micromonospora globispora TaxID=1450148 RepID=UPI001C8A7831|nr:tetratricopeptide repeat protein [Micromonospora globispora]